MESWDKTHGIKGFNIEWGLVGGGDSVEEQRDKASSNVQEVAVL